MIFDVIKVIIYGIVEGITEWLPISSTGHLILLHSLIPLKQPEEFWNVFKVFIQLGAILSIVVLFWSKLWPFSRDKSREQMMKTFELWIKVVIACIPAAVLGLPLDNIIDAHLSSPVVVAVMLIVYGVIFILMENFNKKRHFNVKNTSSISYLLAFFIGIFQALALIPGTSRSGATIIGAMLLGCTRTAAAEFSFFLGIPTMFGASLLKIIKHGFGFGIFQYFLLLLGFVISFIVGLFAVSSMMGYVRKHNFKAFGYYRIAAGIVVLVYFCFIAGH